MYETQIVVDNSADTLTVTVFVFPPDNATTVFGTWRFFILTDGVGPLCVPFTNEFLVCGKTNLIATR